MVPSEETAYQNPLIYVLLNNTSSVILIPSFIVGLILVLIYVFRCRKCNIEVEQTIIVHCFLISAGIVGGILLILIATLSSVVPELAGLLQKIHELNIYVVIGGVNVIVTFFKQAKTYVFFNIPINNDSNINHS